MSRVERFDKWRRDHPKRMEVVYESALENFGMDREAVDVEIKRMRHWIATNEHKKVTNKREWGRFISNWLSNNQGKRHGTKRINPSKFKKTVISGLPES